MSLREYVSTYVQPRAMAAAHAAVRNKRSKKAVELPDDMPVMFDDAPNKEIRRVNLEKKTLNAQVRSASYVHGAWQRTRRQHRPVWRGHGDRKGGGRLTCVTSRELSRGG